MKIKLISTEIAYVDEGVHDFVPLLCTAFVYKYLGGVPEKIILILSLEDKEGMTPAKFDTDMFVVVNKRQHTIYCGLYRILFEFLKDKYDFYFKIEDDKE